MLKVVEWKGKKVAQMVPFASIHFDGTIKSDMESENVKEIAESIERGGVVLQPSLVEKASGKIVCGRDRILAQHRLGRKDVLVMYVTGTAEDFAQARLDENVCRKDVDKGKLRAKHKEDLSSATTQEAISLRDRNVIARDDKPKRGRPSEGKGAAVAAIAKAEGVAPSTVASSISRAKKKAEAEDLPEKETAAPVSCLSPTFENCCDGRPVPETIEEAAKTQQSLVDQMDRALITFGAALTKYREAVKGTIPVTSGVPHARTQVTEADLADFETWRNAVAFKIRGMRPSCVCPSCKLVEGYQEKCNSCWHRGFISAAEHAATPKALLVDDDEAVLSRDGEEVNLREYLDEKAF